MSSIELTPKQEEILKRIKPIITDKLNVEEEEVTPEAKFTDDLGADSLDFVELSMEIEKEFDIRFEDTNLEKIATVQDLISLIDGMIN